MKRIKHFVKTKAKKHGKKLSLFLIIGIFKAILSVTLIWLLIDIVHMQTLLGSTIAVVIVFFIIYFSYILIGLVKPQFLKYATATGILNGITIILIWFFVDFIGFSGALSSTIVIGALFVIRYLLFNKVGLINHG